jgi:hypothetical protein
LLPSASARCIELLVGHYRSRIVLIDELIEKIARLDANLAPACASMQSGLSGVPRDTGVNRHTERAAGGDAYPKTARTNREGNTP